jgi:hypothetical protein
VWQKEVEFQRNDTKRQYTNEFESMAGAGFTVEEMLDSPSLDIIEKGMAPYWPEGELERTRDQMLIDALINTGRYEDAKELANTSDAFTTTEKKSRLEYAKAAEARVQRENAERLRLRQEEVGRQMYVGVVSGNITDPQTLLDAVNVGDLSIANAKYLRDFMLNPEPPKHDLVSESRVLQAIEDIGTGAGTKQDALDTLIANVQSLDPEKGSSLLNKIYVAQDKNMSEQKREARSIMEELIRDRDEFSGLFTDDERQILAHAEAYLMLNDDIEKAAKEGKPMTRKEILIRATQIGRQMKRKIKNEEEAEEEPSFEPEGKPAELTDEDLIATLSPERQEVYRKANQATKDKMIANLRLAERGKKAIELRTGRPYPRKAKKFPVPAFVMDGKEPEIVFDSKGKELGLKLKRGGVWKIGESGYINGRLYEYTGNGNWKAVK